MRNRFEDRPRYENKGQSGESEFYGGAPPESPGDNRGNSEGDESIDNRPGFFCLWIHPGNRVSEVREGARGQ